MLGEHAAYGPPDSLHEEALHVPLFLRHPSSMTGQRILDDGVELTDVHPTLCEWFGLPAGRTDGRSLLGTTDSFRPREFAERGALAVRERGELSLRTADWRYGAAEGELFDCSGAGSRRRPRRVDDPQTARALEEALRARRTEQVD